MSFVQYVLNMSIDIFGIAVSVTGIICSIIASRINSLVKRYFVALFAYLLLYVTSNMVALLFRGTSLSYGRTILYLSNFGEFLMSALLAYRVSNYLADISIREEERKQRYKNILLALLAGHVLLLLISQFTGLYYVIDENNYYHRSTFFPLAFLFGGSMLLLDMKLILDDRGSLSTKQIVGFWAFLIAPFLAVIAQMFFYGIDVLVIATVAAGIFMFSLMVLDQTERNLDKQTENEKIKTSLLLGQISPHFIFNSLMSIQDLCYTDPKMAADSIGDFAVYLRHNMEDLTISEMIPFEKEMGFIEEYVRLEKLDPDRNFEVVYDLEERDFLIPTLTLQPVVENAINYGALTCKQETGKVVISTRREKDAIKIEVWNNFEGKRSVTSGQKKHRSIATENIRSRLKHFCDGTYEIEIREKDAVATLCMPLDKVTGGNGK